MNWNQEMIMDLIDLYKEEPVLWDRNHPSFDDVNKSHRAWERIGQELEYPPVKVEDLQLMMRCVRQQYRWFKRGDNISVIPQDRDFIRILDSFLGKTSTHNTTTTSTQVENIGDVQGVKVEGAAAAPQVEDSCSHCGKSLVEKFLQLPERERLNMMLEICGTLKHKLDVK